MGGCFFSDGTGSRARACCGLAADLYEPLQTGVVLRNGIKHVPRAFGVPPEVLFCRFRLGYSGRMKYVVHAGDRLSQRIPVEQVTVHVVDWQALKPDGVARLAE